MAGKVKRVASGIGKGIRRAIIPAIGAKLAYDYTKDPEGTKRGVKAVAKEYGPAGAAFYGLERGSRELTKRRPERLTARAERAVGRKAKNIIKPVARRVPGGMGAGRLALKVGRGVGRIAAPVTLGIGAYDVGRMGIEGAKAGRDIYRAHREKRASEKKYGTVERATRTRRAKRGRESLKKIKELGG